LKALALWRFSGKQMEQQDNRIISYYWGLDLAQSKDYTALALLELVTGHRVYGASGFLTDVWLDPDYWQYNIVGLERLELGMKYPEQVQHVASRIRSLPRAGKGTAKEGLAEMYFALDRTGVGRAVYDMFVEEQLEPVAITITGGDKVNPDDAGYRVPKRDLVSAVKVLQSQRRLKVAPGIVHGELLAKEMQVFKYKLDSATGHDSYGAWREGQHDDLVLSVACAVWLAHSGRAHGFAPLNEDVRKGLTETIW
jgi:hypothetical protein